MNTILLVVILVGIAGIFFQLHQIKKGEQTLMADAVDLTSAYTTLHQDLVAENSLIKQILAGVASGVLTQTQAQTLLDGMNSDDADAKSNITAIQAALAPPTPAPAPAPAPTA